LTPIQPKIPHHKMMNPHLKTLAAGTLALAAFAVTSFAQPIASDNAGNYLGDWTNGSNSGTGFGAWDLYGEGSFGNFIGDSVDQGFGNVNTSGSAFGMWGNPSGSNFSNAQRAFSDALSVGNSFSIQLAIAFRNGAKGISLFSGGFAEGNEIWNFNVGGDQYTAGGVNQTWAYDQTSVFNLSATQLSATSIGIALTRGSDSYSTTINDTGLLTGFRLYVGSTEDGAALNNLYFNNLTVVPEPSTYALLGLGAASVLWRIRRRKTS
jgi:hypothetical protein